MRRKLCTLLLALAVLVLLPRRAGAVLATPRITAANTVSNGIQLKWSPVEGAQRYRVFRMRDGRWFRLGDTTATAYTDTGAQPGGSYTYTLRCVSENGASYTSSYDRQGVTLYRGTTPVISTAHCANNGVTLSWNAVDGVECYRVFVRTDTGWKALANVSGTGYTDTAALPGRSYTYTVRGVSPESGRYITYYNTAGVTVSCLPTPVLTHIAADGTTVTLRWGAIPGAERYRVYRRVNGTWKRLLDTAGDSCEVTGLPAHEYCTFTLRCISTDGRHFTSGFQTSGFSVTTGERRTIICIDPGHQAKGNAAKEPIGPGASQSKAKVTGGAYGRWSKLNEHELNLQVSLKLESELKNRGYQVIMTRTTANVNLSNRERAEIANKAKADVFLRIHANGDSNSSVSGIMTLAPTSANPYLTAANIAASQKLAGIMLDSMVSATGAKRQRVWKTDTMSGINWSEVPVTIIEMGYMSNPAEDRLMATAAYQAKLVRGIADGVDRYLQESGK
jgi:N-acetylmuramoyl-L-alanine amidase